MFLHKFSKDSTTRMQMSVHSNDETILGNTILLKPLSEVFRLLKAVVAGLLDHKGATREMLHHLDRHVVTYFARKGWEVEAKSCLRIKCELDFIKGLERNCGLLRILVGEMLWLLGEEVEAADNLTGTVQLSHRSHESITINLSGGAKSNPARHILILTRD